MPIGLKRNGPQHTLYCIYGSSASAPSIRAPAAASTASAAGFDGFESFIRFQYVPTNINILVGSDSQACYGVNMTVMRRKGRMTGRQKEVRSMIDRVWKPPRRSLQHTVTRLFRDFEPQITNTIAATGSWTLHMDEKREYP